MRRPSRLGRTPRVADPDEAPRRPVRNAEQDDAYPPGQREVLRLQARAGNRIVARMLLRGAQVPAEPVVQRIGAAIETYVRDGQQVTHTAHEEWGAGTIVAIDGERYVVEFPAAGGAQTVDAADLELAGSNAETQSDEGKAQEAAALPRDERSEVPVATYLSIEKSKPKKWHLVLLDESRREIVKVPDVSESVVKGYVVTPKSLIVQEKMSMVRGGTALPLKPGVPLPGPLANAYAKTLKDLAAKKELETYLARYAETSGGSATPTSSAATKTFPTQAKIMERLRQLQTTRSKTTATGHGVVTMTSILLRSPVELMVENENRPITHLYTQVGRTDKQGRAVEIRCYLGNARGAYQRVHTSLTEDDPVRAHTMVQTGAQVAVPQWKGRAVGERVGFDSVENGKGLGGRTLDARTDAKASTVKDANCQVWIRGLDFMTLTEDQRARCRQLAGTFNLALDAAIADVMDETFDLYRTVTGTTQDFQILDDVWQGDEKAKARALTEPPASGSRKPVESKQTESTSEGRGMSREPGTVRALDARDEAAFGGHRFAPSVTGIRDLGQCFWDTLRRRGVDDVALSKAADACDIAVDAAVDVDRIERFLDALATKADRKVSVVLVRFDIFSLEYVGHETIGPGGGGAEEIFVGFFYDPSKGLGHYVPELD